MHTNGLGLLMGTGCYNLPQPNNTEKVLCPDLSYVLPAREATMPQRGSFLVGAPDLIIEIASLSDTHPEMTAKIGDYLQAGVALIWVLWPTSRTIEIWRTAMPSQPTTILQESDLLDGEAIVPGFQCPVRDLFAM